MILVKNRLKRLKKDTDDNMLHYLKFSHLDARDEPRVLRDNVTEDNFDFIPNIRTYKNIATQFPDIRNRSTQTTHMEDKATDTLDDLHKIDYKYKLEGKSKKLSKHNFMSQVNAIPVIDKNRMNNSSDGSSSGSESLGYLRRGVRLAEMTGNAILTSLNLASSGVSLVSDLADYIAEATLNNNDSIEVEEENGEVNENDLEVVSVNSSPPMTINSSPPPESVHSSEPSVPTSPQSIPVPTSPQSSRASSRSSRSSTHKKN